MKSSANRYEKAFLETINIRNDLIRLIPVGTLNFYGLPEGISPLTGLGTTSGCKAEWSWLDIEYLVSLCGGSVSPLVEHLKFLVSNKYVVASYKTVSVRLSNLKNFNFFKIRIYAIPSDIQGARFINEWQMSRVGYNSIRKLFGKLWQEYINIMDFSKSSWMQKSTCTVSDILENGILLIPCQDPKVPMIWSGLSNHHIKRWLKNDRYHPARKSDQQDTLLSRVQKIYDSIDSPFFLTDYSKSDELSIYNIAGTQEKMDNLIYTGDDIEGIKTKLYPFQRRSLAKMLEKESKRLKALVPNYIKLKYVTSDTSYYYDLQNCKIVIHPEIYTLPRGGILAENMGLGKTLICLSLICVTKCDCSKIPDDIMLHGESDSDVEEIFPGVTNLKPRNNSSILNLVDYCVKKINIVSLPWKYFINDLPESVINRLKDSPGSFQISITDNDNETRTRQTLKSSRNKDFFSRKFKSLYLCTTTLIIVPENLFHQWHNEIRKHVKLGFLTALYISNQFKKTVQSEYGNCTYLLNDAKYLISFDIVLISSSIFAKYLSQSVSKNILSEVYWKRLIIDEGHSVSSKSSRVSLLCKSLYAERVWAVSGTPTSGMTKLYMDEDRSSQLSKSSADFNKTKYSVTSKFNAKDDLNKLGSIVANFLKIEPYHSQPKIWNTCYIKPLISGTYGYEISMMNLLNNIVIRHNLKDVNCDLKLPQLHHKAIFLKPSYHNTLSINLFTAVLAVNAVSSERTDIDYMFHPSNRQRLRRLITNLQRATFNWTGFKQKDVESLIHVSTLCLEKKRPDGSEYYNSRDSGLLRKSIEVSKIALSNPRWRTMSLLHEMNYYVEGLPKLFTKYFGIGLIEERKGIDYRHIGVFGAPHLSKVQEFFYKNRFIYMENDDVLKAKMETFSKPFWNSYWEDSIRRNVERFNKQDAIQELHTKISKKDIEDSADEPNIVRDFEESNRIEENVTLSPGNKKPIKLDDSEEYSAFSNRKEMEFTYIDTNSSLQNEYSATSEEIKKSKILGTASSKLSYLGSRLLEHKHQNIKSIVFFEFEDSAYYLAELLDILGLKYILYATFIPPAERAKNLSEFTNYPSEENGGICLIMDLRLSAHGLTIIAATRVYFLNPVWKKSIEAQAIKRAHRIGQQNDVYVETLILEGTLEEEIYKKRMPENSRFSESFESSQKKFVIDDTGMQEFVLKHKFLNWDLKEDEFAPFASPALSSENVAINSESDYSLLSHFDQLYSFEEVLYKKWEAYVFSDENISKFNESVIKKKIDISNEYLEHEPKKRPNDLSNPNMSNNIGSKKKVRF